MNQQNLTQLETKLDNLKEFLYKFSEISLSMAKSLEKQPLPLNESPQRDQIMKIAKEIIRENGNGLTLSQIADAMNQRHPMWDRSIVVSNLLTALTVDPEITHNGRHNKNRIFKIDQ